MERENNSSSIEHSDITVLADLSQEGESQIPIKVKPDVFKRLEETLSNKGLSSKKIATGVVVFGLAVGAGIAAKKIIDKRREVTTVSALTDEEFEKFQGIVEENYEDISNYVQFGLHGRQQDVEDLTQRVFLKTLTSYSRFKPKKNLENPERSWLFRIAHNTLVNFYRDDKRKSKKVTEIPSDEEGSPREQILVDPLLSSMHSVESDIKDYPDEEVLSVRKSLAGLSEDSKLMLYLKHVESLQNKEIGYVLGRTEGAIKSLYSRTLDKLKTEIELEE